LPLVFFAFLSYLSLAFSGFGGMIIPITLGANRYPIKWMLTVLVPVTLLSNTFILLRHRRYIDTRLVFRKALPFMGIGLGVGIVIFQFLPGEALKRSYGVMVVLLSVSELRKLVGRRSAPLPFGKRLSALLFFLAGILHGIFASGGPILVYVLTRLQLDKATFRSTLSPIWLSLNIALTISYGVTGQLQAETLRTCVYLIPSLVLGIWMGERLHRKVDERVFKIVIYVFLLLTGISIVVR